MGPVAQATGCNSLTTPSPGWAEPTEIKKTVFDCVARASLQEINEFRFAISSKSDTTVLRFCVKYVIYKASSPHRKRLFVRCNFSKCFPSAATDFWSLSTHCRNVHLNSILDMCERHWNRTDPRGDLEFNFLRARHFSRCGNKTQSRGARSGE